MWSGSRPLLSECLSLGARWVAVLFDPVLDINEDRHREIREHARRDHVRAQEFASALRCSGIEKSQPPTCRKLQFVKCSRLKRARFAGFTYQARSNDLC